jgi:hypothetical protein
MELSKPGTQVPFRMCESLLKVVTSGAYFGDAGDRGAPSCKP